MTNVNLRHKDQNQSRTARTRINKENTKGEYMLEAASVTLHRHDTKFTYIAHRIISQFL
jgi:hypothetical protein